MNALSAVPVSIQGVTPTTYAVLALLLTAIVTLIKVWPVLAKQAADAKAQMRGEERADLSDCHAKVEALTTRIAALEERQHDTDLKMFALSSGYGLVEAEALDRDPESPAVKQARIILRNAFRLTELPADIATLVQPKSREQAA